MEVSGEKEGVGKRRQGGEREGKERVEQAGWSGRKGLAGRAGCACPAHPENLVGSSWWQAERPAAHIKQAGVGVKGGWWSSGVRHAAGGGWAWGVGQTNTRAVWWRVWGQMGCAAAAASPATPPGERSVMAMWLGVAC
jgi:hypothetical protein